VARRGRAHGGDRRRETIIELDERARAEVERREVHLEVEPRNLGRVPRSSEVCQDVQRDRGRSPPASDQKRLLLGAHATHAAVERPVLHHQLEGSQVGQEVSRVAPEGVRGQIGGNVLTAHGPSL
jgi:hypothetical protein